MPTIFEAAALVWSHGGELKVIDGVLGYRGPRLPDDLRAVLRHHKPSFLATHGRWEADNAARVAAPSVPEPVAP